MSKIDDIITQVEIDEGGSKVTNDPSDGGGRTQYGISERSNPEAWKDGKVTEAEAREIYFNKYVKGPKFDLVLDPKLQAQLIDFGVTSGPMVAIMKLQGVLGLKVDGVIGPITLTKINTTTNLNNLLLSERIKMICKIVSKDTTQIKYLNGWINRSLEFMNA